MKQANDKLIQLLLNNNVFNKAELFTFTLINGVVLRYTSLDINLTVGGLVYKAAPITRGSIKETTGVSVDDMDITWLLKLTDTLPGSTTPIIQAMRYGAFDNATFSLDKVFSPNPWVYNMPNISDDYVLKGRFNGRVDIDQAGMTYAKLRIKSMLELLDVSMPRNLYMPSCGRVMYSSGCGVNRAALTKSGTVQSGSTITLINTGLTFANDYYNNGVITFTSGVNSGIRRSVRTSSSGAITTILPFPKLPGEGDSFIIYPGCDKTRDTCKKYGNQDNFKGFLYIPVPETVLY